MGLSYDFEYDGRYLSSFGYILCTFDSSGTDTPDSGAKITFTTVSKKNGAKFFLAGTKYESCIQSQFSICKDPNVYTGEEKYISDIEYREIARWLNRHQFHKFKLDDYDDFDGINCYFMASFNLSKTLLCGRTIGIQLDMETNAPFGYGDAVTKTITVDNVTQNYSVYDTSDDEGYIYPNLKITCAADGDLELENMTEGVKMVVRNCVSGEVVTIDGETLSISSSVTSHRLEKDFNFIFFRIGNTFENRNNQIKASIPCTIKLSYEPIIKNTPF